MENDAARSTWYWGICSEEFVGDFIDRSANGTFLVFKSPGNEDLTLMYRFKGNTKSVNIYHRDGLYGFTEPLGFEKLYEALDAHNMSQTDTRDTLIHPAVKPGANSDSRNSRHSLTVSEQQSLLRAIKRDVKIMDEKDEELDSLAKQNEIFYQKLNDTNCQTESLNRVLNTLEGQMKKHHEFSKDLTTTTQMATVISENFMKLTTRIGEISKEIEETEIEKSKIEKEYLTINKKYTDLFHTQQELKKQIIANQGVLVQSSPESAEFVDSLITRNFKEHVDIVVPQSARESTVRERLLNTDDGTFIVRRNSSRNTPFSISVAYAGQVYDFQIFETDRCYGLDLKACVFDDIQELVEHYADKPLGIHNENLENLRLQKQLILKQSLRDSRASFKADN
ncbi:Phosphatidylinositol 3-kinase regulatory subunit gamma [Mactra antiquata]